MDDEGGNYPDPKKQRKNNNVFTRDVENLDSTK